MPQCVYVFERKGLYKIGYSWNVAKRLRAFPQARLIHVIPVRERAHSWWREAQYLEGLLHNYFYDQAIGGEWFRLKAADVHLITSITHWPTRDVRAWLEFPDPGRD